MNIFDNSASLILFKHKFTLMIIKSPVFEVQANFHHQMLVRLGLVFFQSKCSADTK